MAGHPAQRECRIVIVKTRKPGSISWSSVGEHGFQPRMLPPDLWPVLSSRVYGRSTRKAPIIPQNSGQLFSTRYLSAAVGD